MAASCWVCQVAALDSLSRLLAHGAAPLGPLLLPPTVQRGAPGWRCASTAAACARGRSSGSCRAYSGRTKSAACVCARVCARACACGAGAERGRRRVTAAFRCTLACRFRRPHRRVPPLPALCVTQAACLGLAAPGCQVACQAAHATPPGRDHFQHAHSGRPQMLRFKAAALTPSPPPWPPGPRRRGR